MGDSTALAGGFEFFVAGGVDFILPAGEAVCRGDVADGAMQALGIVVVDEVAGDAVGVFKGQRGFGTDGLLFERLVEAFEFSFGLGMMRGLASGCASRAFWMTISASISRMAGRMSHAGMAREQSSGTQHRK